LGVGERIKRLEDKRLKDRRLKDKDKRLKRSYS